MSKPEVTLIKICVIMFIMNLISYIMNPYNGIKMSLFVFPLIMTLVLITKILGAIRKALWG